MSSRMPPPLKPIDMEPIDMGSMDPSRAPDPPPRCTGSLPLEDKDDDEEEEKQERSWTRVTPRAAPERKM